MTNEDIISKYYEISTDNMSANLLAYVNKMIDTRQSEFALFCTESGLQLSELLDLLYKPAQKFPYFLSKSEIAVLIQKSIEDKQKSLEEKQDSMEDK